MTLEKAILSNFLNLNFSISKELKVLQGHLSHCQTALAKADRLCFISHAATCSELTEGHFKRAWLPGLCHSLSTFLSLATVSTIAAHTEIGFFVGVGKKEGSIRQGVKSRR